MDSEKEIMKKINIDWEKFWNFEKNMTETDKVLIQEHFQEYLKGFSCFKDLSTPELKGHLEVFKSGWMMAILFISENHEAQKE